MAKNNWTVRAFRHFERSCGKSPFGHKGKERISLAYIRKLEALLRADDRKFYLKSYLLFFLRICCSSRIFTRVYLSEIIYSRINVHNNRVINNIIIMQEAFFAATTRRDVQGEFWSFRGTRICDFDRVRLEVTKKNTIFYLLHEIDFWSFDRARRIYAFRRNLDSISFAVALQREFQIKASINKNRNKNVPTLIGRSHAFGIDCASCRREEDRTFGFLFPSDPIPTCISESSVWADRYTPDFNLRGVSEAHG